MKKIILVAAMCLMGLASFSQTATDFTATDCDGTSFNLFTELNSGKVIVICWVMPCGACTGPALTTKYVVESYNTSNPHTVYMYLVDDYANTSCLLLQNWMNNIGITGPTVFSDASISMDDYGTTGMPKIVVIAGGDHTVFFNANDVVNAGDLQTAINEAIQAIGIDEKNSFASSISVSPNPASDKSELKFSLAENAKAEIRLYNMRGSVVKEIYDGKLPQGENSIGFSTSDIAAGTYLIKISNGTRSNYLNLVIAR